MTAEPILLAADVELVAPDLPDAWAAVRQMQALSRVEARIVLRWYFPEDGMVQVWDLAGRPGAVPSVARIEQMQPTEDDMWFIDGLGDLKPVDVEGRAR